MPITMECECGKKLRVPDAAIGRKAKCPACARVFVIAPPEPGPVAPIDPQLGFEPAEAPEKDPYDFADDTDLAAQAAAARAAAQRRQMMLASKTVERHTATAKPAPVISLPEGATGRPYRYLVLLLTMIPLVWATFSPDHHDSLRTRIQQTISAHPELEEKFNDLPRHATKEQVFELLPNQRVDGALLGYDTWVHWGFAAITGAGFFGLILLLFPPGHTKILHLFLVGLFTGTLGIVLLLALQWAAFHVPLRIGSGLITIIIDIIWLIGQSYSMALGDHSLIPSVLGFTAGVGFCEEACKALPLIWKARSTGFVSWRSAMLWGLISGVGFGVSEAITYSHDYYNGVQGPQIYFVRFISCVALHGIWAAATGINVYRRQDHFRGTLHPLEWILQVGITVIVPMVLHGLYDTLLKQQYDWLAVAVAIASFGWLAWQIELAKKKFDPATA